MSRTKVELYVPVHKGLRRLYSDLIVRAGQTDWDDSGETSRLKQDWDTAVRLMDSHHRHEEEHLHPVVARAIPGGHREIEEEHEVHAQMLYDLDAHFQRIVTPGASAGTRERAGFEFYEGLNLYYADVLRHMRREDVDLQRALNDACSREELAEAERNLIGSVPPDEMMLWIDVILPALNVTERVEMLSGMKADAPPTAFAVVAERVRCAIGEEDWNTLAARVGV